MYEFNQVKFIERRKTEDKRDIDLDLCNSVFKFPLFLEFLKIFTTRKKLEHLTADTKLYCLYFAIFVTDDEVLTTVFVSHTNGASNLKFGEGLCTINANKLKYFLELKTWV